MPNYLNPNRIPHTITGAVLAMAMMAGAQAPAPLAQATASTPAPAPPPAATAPAPLSTFVLTGPLQWLPPATFDAGPFGKLSVNGIMTGFAQFQNNPVPGDDNAQATLSNGQIFIQKADGKLQYYIQAGVYTMPTLSVPFVNAQNTVNNFYGPVPVAYLKLQAAKNTQFLIGSLPTLMGAESTFTYQNFNIERGIVWNQENAINRGIQVNQTMGKYLLRLLQLERWLLFQSLLMAFGLGDLYEGAAQPGIRWDGEPRADRSSDSSDTGAEQQLHAHRDLHVHQGPMDHLALLPVRQAADQRECRCSQGHIRNRRGVQPKLRL